MTQAEPGVLRVVSPQTRRDDAAADESICEAEGLPSPGRYIHEQRTRRGMSVEQLAVATKIPRTSVLLLEEDRFDELPGPVFVKGFLRCSARALGVDPDAVMELLYERERAQLHARRRERPPPGPTGAGGEAVVPRMPPRVRKGAPPPSTSTLREIVARMPSVSVLLWIVIAVLVAMVMMAAFNLMGATPTGPT